MSFARLPRRRRRGTSFSERALSWGIGLAIVVGVLSLFWFAWGVYRTQATVRMASTVITEIRQTHRNSGDGIPAPVDMARYLREAGSVPANVLYTGADPACAVESPWGGCVELSSEVTGTAEYLTMVFHGLPRRICTGLMTIGPDGGNSLAGTAVAAATYAPGQMEPRLATIPNDRGQAAELCRGAERAAITLMWPN
jgi:hypothetical protein